MHGLKLTVRESEVTPVDALLSSEANQTPAAASIASTPVRKVG